MIDRHVFLRVAGVAVVGAALWSPATLAQQQLPANRDGDLDVTMRVISDPAAKVPDEIVRRIPLPTARPAQPPGGDAASQRVDGQDRTREAQELGRQLGQDIAAGARERAEEARRNAAPPPSLPGTPNPVPPGPPVPPPAPPAGPAPTPGG
jgi:hypothetical protein